MLTAIKEEKNQDVAKHDIDTVKHGIEDVRKSQHFHSLQYDGFKNEQQKVVSNHITLETNYAELHEKIKVHQKNI